MSHSHGNASSANDPRLPSAAKPYTPRPVAPEDLPVDYSGFIAVILGVSGVMFRVKFHLIVALLKSNSVVETITPVRVYA